MITLVFIQQLVSVMRPHGIDNFADECPANSNGCIRGNKFNQFRANNIEMRYPVTFKQMNLTKLITDHIKEKYNQDAFVLSNESTNATTYIAKKMSFYFRHTTFYGMVIDTLITVHDCV